MAIIEIKQEVPNGDFCKKNFYIPCWCLTRKHPPNIPDYYYCRFFHLPICNIHDSSYREIVDVPKLRECIKAEVKTMEEAKQAVEIELGMHN